MSLRSKLIRLAHANPDLRADLLPLLKVPKRGAWGGGQEHTMGAWGGQEYTWPKISTDWNESDYKIDALGDYYRIEYMWVGRPSMVIFVKVDAAPHINSEGSRPGTYIAQSMGKSLKGTWKNPEGIPRALDEAKRWAEKLLRKLQTEIKGLSSSKWDVSYDGYQIDATYTNPNADRYSDSHMTVTFSDVPEALIEGGRSRADIWYSAGADYGGHFGVKEQRESYSTISDIHKILRKAEGLFQKWDA